MKIAVINDTHCGVRNSSEIFLDNAEDFWSETFFPYLKEHGIKRIIHMGDYYENRKMINFRALNRNRKNFLNVLRKEGIHMDIIPGNHDVFYKNTNELNSLKELLGHYMGEVTIHMEPTVVNYDGMPIAFLPWINQENYNHSIEFINNCKAPWMVSHLELNGFEMMRGVKAHHGLDHAMFKRFEQVLSGHYHTRSEQDNIIYCGTQMEFSWSDAGDPKYFHVIDTDTRELTAIRNYSTLFEKIVYDDSKTCYNTLDLSHLDNKFVKIVVVCKSDLYAFDRFVDNVQNRKIHELKIAENFNEFLGDNVEDEAVSVEDTTALLDSYVDAVDTELNKDRLKSALRHILIEAQALEIS